MVVLPSAEWIRDFLATTPGRLVLIACILILIIPARWLLRHIVLWRVRAWSRHPGNTVKQGVARSLIGPICFVPVVAAAALIAWIMVIYEPVAANSYRINLSLFALVVFWALFEIMAPLFEAFYGRAQLFSHAMINWTVTVGKIVIVAIGIAVILGIWGIHVGPVLAGLGLFGVAAGLGAQNVVKNLIAGMFIIGEGRFKNGDWIEAEHVVDGVVENIGLRATKVRRWDMAPAYVPNALLADNAVTNYGQMPYRKISWVIGLEYRTTVEQLRRVRDAIEAYILSSEDFAHPPDAPWTFVRVDSFGDSSMNLLAYCFSRTTDWGGWLKVKEALVYAIKQAVNDAGTDFAFPSRSLYVEAMPTGTEVSPLPQPDQSRTRDRVNTG